MVDYGEGGRRDGGADAARVGESIMTPPEALHQAGSGSMTGHTSSPHPGSLWL